MLKYARSLKGIRKMNKKTVLVTGSSIGLGASIIRKFASNNYNVIINYNTNEEKAEQLANELSNKYHTDYLLVKQEKYIDVKNALIGAECEFI